MNSSTIGIITRDHSTNSNPLSSCNESQFSSWQLRCQNSQSCA